MPLWHTPCNYVVMYRDHRGLLRNVFRSLSMWMILEGAARAQCVPVPGTGCAPAALPVCAQAPRIGQPFEVCLSGGGTFGEPVLLGFFSCGPRWTFSGFPLCATASPCVLAGSLLASIVSPRRACLSGAIPNDPRLVGLGLCVQGLYAPSRNPSCLVVSGAVQVTIQA